MLTTSLQHELFHVNQAYNLLVIVVYDMKRPEAPRALKIACDNCKQKLYCVNWPLQQVGSNGHFIYVQVLKVIILVLRVTKRKTLALLMKS